MPTMKELEAAEAEVSAPLYPYDIKDKYHARAVALTPAPDGTPREGTIRVRVVQTYGEALGHAEVDYYHPGGVLTGTDGKSYGTHPPGWFIKGYKWQDDRPLRTD